MLIIDDEFALPAPETEAAHRLEYARSKCDPCILISCKTGETYTRRDGQKWEWPGYKIERGANNRVTREPATGMEDTVRYRGDSEERVEHILPKQKQKSAA